MRPWSASAGIPRLLDRLRLRLVDRLPSVPVRYGISALVLMAVALTRFLLFADFPAWFLFVPAVVVVTLFLGGGSGLLATLIATLNAGYVLVATRSLHGATPSHWAAVAVFGITNLGLVTLVVALRRTLVGANAAHAALAQSNAEATEREAFLASVLASSTDCIKVLALDGKLTFMSEGGKRVMEVSDFNAIKGCPWPSFWANQGNLDASNAVDAARHGRASSFVGNASTMKGTPKWWHVAVSPILDPDGRPDRILSVSRDITALRESEEERDRFVRLAENSTDFIGMAHVDGRMFYVNDAARRMVGLENTNVTELTITDFFPPEQVAEVTTEILSAVDREGHWSGELTFRHFGTGELIPVLYSAFPVTDADGKIVGYGTVTRDFRARKRAEEDLQMMNGELAHRLKNVLSVVQSVARQTLRNTSDTEAASRDLSARLVALGAAADMLTGTSWRSADLRELVTRTLSPHGQLGQRILIDGPHISLQPQVVVAFALALHELATNAAKYGALSNEEGNVVVHWQVDGFGSDARFQLTWREHGGPPVQEPTYRGFGSTLIERSMRSYFGGTALTEFKPEGLVFSMDAELSKAILLSGEA